MKSYLVTWEIDIEADTPEDAAREAFFVQRDADSVAMTFEVQEQMEVGYGEKVRVDLEEVGL